MNKEWIGVDLDGTLAHYDEWKGNDHIGEPVMPMINRVRGWLNKGENIKIFTARANDKEAIEPIYNFCLKYFGKILPITNQKDHNMKELWDDRAITVQKNTGIPYFEL